MAPKRSTPGFTAVRCAMSMPPLTDHNLRASVTAFCRRDEIRAPLLRLRGALPAGAQLCVVGGALRNHLIDQVYGQGPPTVDIDVFIGKVGPQFELDRILREEACVRTDLGGLRWFPVSGGMAFDLSLLANFLIIRKCRLAPTTTSLLAAIDFDVNAVIHVMDGDTLLKKSCVDAIRRRTLGFNTRWLAEKALLGFRCLLLRRKTGFAVSRDVFTFLKTALDLESLARIRSIAQKKLNRGAARELLADYRHICACADFEAYRRFVDGGDAPK